MVIDPAPAPPVAAMAPLMESEAEVIIAIFPPLVLILAETKELPTPDAVRFTPPPDVVSATPAKAIEPATVPLTSPPPVEMVPDVWLKLTQLMFRSPPAVAIPAAISTLPVPLESASAFKFRVTGFGEIACVNEELMMILLSAFRNRVLEMPSGIALSGTLSSTVILPCPEPGPEVEIVTSLALSSARRSVTLMLDGVVVGVQVPKENDPPVLLAVEITTSRAAQDRLGQLNQQKRTE